MLVDLEPYYLHINCRGMKTPKPVFTEESLFENNEKKWALYQVLKEFITSLGDIVVTPTKSQIAFGAKRKFAWVWLPPAWAKNRPKDSIVLTFGLDHRIEHSAIVEVVNPYPHRWVHHVIIQDKS